MWPACRLKAGKRYKLLVPLAYCVLPTEPKNIFLGDGILQMILSVWIHEHTNWDEGTMTKFRSNIVDNENLSHVKLSS